MKLIITSFLAFAIFCNAHAQGNPYFGSSVTSYAGPAQYGSIGFPRGEIMFSNTNTQNQFYLFHNAYTNSSGAQSYRNTGVASAIAQDNGTIFFFNSVSGTAGSPITWQARMLIANNGNVGIGASPVSKLTLGSSISTMVSTSGLTLGSDQKSIEFLHSSSGAGYGAKLYGVDEGNGLTSF
jgi:hypothetical protein